MSRVVDAYKSVESIIAQHDCVNPHYSRRTARIQIDAALRGWDSSLPRTLEQWNLHQTPGVNLYDIANEMWNVMTEVHAAAMEDHDGAGKLLEVLRTHGHRDFENYL